MNNPSRVPVLPPSFPCPSPAVPLTPNPWPLTPAVPPAVILLLAFTLLFAACGRRPTEPTPLPPGTRVVQPTPDFSAPAQVGSSTDNAAQAVRTRLAQQRTQEPPPTPSPSPPTPGPSPLTPGPSPLTPGPYPLAPEVFNRPSALGILAGGGILYAAPGGAVRANLQVGATLTITGRSADSVWYAAYLADGTAGWVPAAQVRVFGDTAELETVQESLGPAVVATRIAQASQPQAPITIAIATPATASATDPDQTDPAPTAAPPTAAPRITGPAVTVIVEGANLRAGPGTDYPVVSVLYQDDTAPLLGRNQTADWLQIDLPTGAAWIFAPLVQTSVPIPDLPKIDPPPNN